MSESQLEHDKVVEVFSKGARANSVEKLLYVSGREVRLIVGVPLDTQKFIPGQSKLLIPETPHVFMVNKLIVLNKDPTRDVVILNAVVMVAHARREVRDDQWYFTHGQKVKDVVEGYVNYAKLNNLPELDFVDACNKEVSHEATELGILVQDIPIEMGVAQVVGSVMGSPFLKHPIPESGIPDLWIHPVKGEFWGLDKVIDRKRARGEVEEKE